jgi:DNA-binding CsgD family transcriptional regulator
MLRRLVHVARPFVHIDTASETVEELRRIVSPAVDVWAVGRSMVTEGGWPEDEEAFRAAVGSRIVFGSGINDRFRMEMQTELSRQGASIVGRYAALNPPPFTFSQVQRQLQPTGIDRWVFDLFHDHGARDALYCAYGPWFVMYVSNRLLTSRALSHETRVAFDAAGAMAVYRLKELMLPVKTVAHPSLSVRERTVLLHLSAGLTAAEIAVRLQVAEASVRSHIHRAVKKLSARSQLHAVATALRERLI